MLLPRFESGSNEYKNKVTSIYYGSRVFLKFYGNMLLVSEGVSAARGISLLLNVNKFRKSKIVPCRLFFKWNSFKKKEETELKPLTGIDDENYTEHLKRVIFDLRAQKEGFRKFMAECKRFYEEEKSRFDFSIRGMGNFEVEDYRTKVRILYKFEKDEDLKGFKVLTDSTYLKGYSSASLKLTTNETAIFSGNLCSDVPKSGDVRIAGYANLQCPKQLRAFFRVLPYNWSEYTHLVFKVRGDGRPYLILLHLENEYEEASYNQYAHALYTRGGPYWQIAKIPFSFFYESRKGKVLDIQGNLVPLHNIINMSITTAGFGGPFKLEIDYIGLEKKDFHKAISPYEQYSYKRSYKK